MTLWVVGKYLSGEAGAVAWEFQSIHDDERLAVANCLTPAYFIGPVALNETAPGISVDWPGAYYPESQAEKVAKALLASAR